MTVRAACLLAVLLCMAPAAAAAQTAPRHAIGADITYSTDADDTEVVRAGLNLDWRYRGPDTYVGFRLERLRYTPSGGNRDRDTRAYLRIADQLGDWKYRTEVGTDGKTVVGSASIHNEAPLRQEYFVERDKIETPIGVTRGLYYTFGGVAVDVPIASGTQATLLGGIQEFTGDNVRVHLRGNLIQTLSSEASVTAQLRTRYFRNSDPREYDYYSPRWYAEVLPVIQVRRFIDGWRLQAAGGLGVQRDSTSKWRASRYGTLRAASPNTSAGWAVTSELTYSSTPTIDAGDYHYLRAHLGVVRSF